MPQIIPPPLGLYLHFPWCLRKCPYCDFNSYALSAELPQQAYVDRLLQDIELEARGVEGRCIETIFIGGGTPSLIAPEALDRLFEGIRSRLTLASDAEITLEANPGSADAGRFRAYRETGVNRLSVGVQSFDDALLRAIGRVHDAAEAIAAVEAAQQAGFDALNIDLMFALPGQDQTRAAGDIEIALSLQPEHLSYYQLTLEPNTLFHTHPPSALPEEEPAFEMERWGRERLAEAGYGRYEISAHARDGHLCQHNLGYWQFADYLGVGAGAHGKLTRDGAIWRQLKARQPTAYLEGVAGSERQVAPEQLPFEFMLNALRLTSGVPLQLFSERTGVGVESIQPVLDRAIERELIELSRDTLCPTSLGLRFLNDLQALFLELY